jgi:hypothetical protein
MANNSTAISALKKALKGKTVDKFEVGTVIRWMSAGKWAYVSIKTDAGWFTSARTNNYYVDSKFDNFEAMLEVLARSETTDIEVATEWEAI